MKSIYLCEICGKRYGLPDECKNHEATCAEEHASGMRLTNALKEITTQAQAAKVCIILDKSSMAGMSLTEFRYDAQRRAIIAKTEL